MLRSGPSRSCVKQWQSHASTCRTLINQIRASAQGSCISEPAVRSYRACAGPITRLSLSSQPTALLHLLTDPSTRGRIRGIVYPFGGGATAVRRFSVSRVGCPFSSNRLLHLTTLDTICILSLRLCQSEVDPGSGSNNGTASSTLSSKPTSSSPVGGASFPSSPLFSNSTAMSDRDRRRQSFFPSMLEGCARVAVVHADGRVDDVGMSGPHREMTRAMCHTQ